MSALGDGGRPLADEFAELAFGKFWASPMGEPTDDPRCRMFDTEQEAIGHAMRVLLALEDVDPSEAAGPLMRFVAVGQFRDDDEAREVQREDSAEHGRPCFPMWTPWGWMDDGGYHHGSFEDSQRLWG